MVASFARDVGRSRGGALPHVGGIAQVSHDVVRIGVLTDMNGNLASLSGKGSVVAATDGGGGFRRQGARQADRDRERRPSEQGRTSARRSRANGSTSKVST